MGTGVEAAAGNEIPRYPELVCYIAEKLGWKIEEFRLFRCRVAYPVLSSLVRVVIPRANDM